MHSWRLSEQTHIRLASRAGALLTLSLLCWCALQVGRPRFSLVESIEGAAISVSVSSRQTPQRVTPPPPPSQATDAAAPAVAMAGGALGAGERVRLWDESADGRILFPSLDQYWRCRDARRSGADLADCPSRDDQRAFGVVGEEDAVDGLHIETDRFQRRRLPRRR